MGSGDLISCQMLAVPIRDYFLESCFFTNRPKCYEPKQRFEGSACAKSLGPDRRRVNSPRAQVKRDCLL